MRRALFLAAGVLALAAAFFQASPTLATFHCMRIHAVMAGYNGDNTIQYVELRMDIGSQNFVGARTIAFRDSAGTLKATFAFPGTIGTAPANLTHASTGDSILIGTSEFNTATTGADADFTFSGANTVAANGGDALHPIQGPVGKVTFEPTSANCAITVPVDSVAYGNYGASLDYGFPAYTLPSPADNRALRLSNLSTAPSANNTEYSLQPASTTTFSVAVANLGTDFTTPRNNGRVVAAMPAAVGGIGGLTDQGQQPPAPADSGGTDSVPYAVAGAAAVALVLLAGGAWYVRRRHARIQAP